MRIGGLILHLFAFFVKQFYKKVAISATLLNKTKAVKYIHTNTLPRRKTMENNEINTETFKSEVNSYRTKASLPHLWWGLVLAGIFAAICLAIGISGGEDAIIGAVVLCVVV